MESKHIIIVALILIVVGLCGYFLFASTSPSGNTLEINDINLQKDATDAFHLIGHVTPLKDFEYLQASITFYDKQGAVIDQVDSSWNAVDAKKDTTLSLDNSKSAVCNGTPAYAVINFYENATMDNPIANATITINGTVADNATASDNATNTSSTVNQDSSSNSDGNTNSNDGNVNSNPNANTADDEDVSGSIGEEPSTVDDDEDVSGSIGEEPSQVDDDDGGSESEKTT